MKNDFETIRNSGKLIYEYIRGSHAYGLNVETSDIDTGGVYIDDVDNILGLRENYKEQIADKKNDNVWYEVGRFLELLMASNPNMLEALFVPERCILHVSPIMQLILDNKKRFLSKKSFNALVGYSIQQVRKARGLNKKIVKPIKVRKMPIDFCYTFKGQGSEPIKEFLDRMHLKQIYCGLVHIDNMDQAYAVFYDWGQHMHMEWKTADEFADFMIGGNAEMFLKSLKYFDISKLYYRLQTAVSEYRADEKHKENIEKYREEFKNIYHDTVPSGYHGIQKEDGSSNDVHLDSVVKGETPICHLLYNKNGYASHCREYKDYKDWEKNRNQSRYESNLDKNYDSKNIMHCVRLIQMGIELAKTGEFNVDREKAGDREFLLDIRNHKYEYDYLIDYCEKKKLELDEAIEKCTLPEDVDHEFVNDLLIKIRKMKKD